MRKQGFGGVRISVLDRPNVEEIFASVSDQKHVKPLCEVIHNTSHRNVKLLAWLGGWYDVNLATGLWCDKKISQSWPRVHPSARSAMTAIKKYRTCAHCDKKYRSPKTAIKKYRTLDRLGMVHQDAIKKYRSLGHDSVPPTRSCTTAIFFIALSTNLVLHLSHFRGRPWVGAANIPWKHHNTWEKSKHKHTTTTLDIFWREQHHYDNNWMVQHTSEITKFGRG